MDTGSWWSIDVFKLILHCFHLNPKACFGDVFGDPVGGPFTYLESFQVGTGLLQAETGKQHPKFNLLYMNMIMVFFFCLVKWSSENVWSQNVPIQSSSIQFGKHRKFFHPRLQHLIQIFTAFAFVQQIGHFYISQTLQVRQNSKCVCSFKVWVQLAASMKYTGLGSFPPTEMTEITTFIWKKIVMVCFIFDFMISFLICLG